jgi:hypothetical protein
MPTSESGITSPHSLEFLEKDRFKNIVGEPVIVCPIHFFQDMQDAVNEYFSSLERDNDLLEKFGLRFSVLYPRKG